MNWYMLDVFIFILDNGWSLWVQLLRNSRRVGLISARIEPLKQNNIHTNCIMETPTVVLSRPVYHPMRYIRL